ncbi:MAG: organic solvent tolerance protein OstA [Bacteroidales bacterium]|nr:organic solvent tolerance protein OstA [Bacteroidales bacterium]
MIKFFTKITYIISFSKKKNLLYNKIIILSLFIFFSQLSFSQQLSKVQLLGANSIEYDANLGNGAKRVIGNVRFKQDNVIMTCDSAYFYSNKNNFDAFSNVHVKQDTSLDIYSDFLRHKGDIKIAEFRNNITLKDDDLTLKTDSLNYNLNDNSGYYFAGGIIIDSSSTLESEYGYYEPNQKLFFFKDSVKVWNEKYTIYTDTLKYNTQTEVVYFFGPTRIINDTNFLYCENGWYNTKTDISQFNENAYYKNKVQVLKGDSLYYDRQNGIGRAFINVELIDSVENIILKGNYGEYFEEPERALIVDSALFIQISGEDTLFLHADTLRSKYDSSGVFRQLKAYYKVKMFRPDFQAKCDSLIYSFEDSIVKLHNEPIIWSDENQITADSIEVHSKNRNLDHFELYNSSLIISRDDSIRFNQIEGVNMTGYMKNKELYKIDVNKKAKTIYFAKDEEGFIGVNISESENMIIFLKDNDVERIIYLKKAKASLYPLDEIQEKKLKLKNFKWLIEHRPLKKEDIFIWDTSEEIKKTE